jgi:hypothetical protein
MKHPIQYEEVDFHEYPNKHRLFGEESVGTNAGRLAEWLNRKFLPIFPAS